MKWLLLLFAQTVAAYTAVPRWGQATVVVNDALFIQGGKVDASNEYYYTTSPNTNDILYLSLSEPFETTSTPWQLVSSSANASTSQGPSLSFHTLSAINNTYVLLFGGQPGPNSPTVITDDADSAFLLNVYNRLAPSWQDEPKSWAGEPTRRIHHSTATIPDGRILIFGGQKADGSELAFSEHYVFDVNGPSFDLLPQDNAPPALFGHVSLILHDGRVLVFGGYNADTKALVPLDTIWILDVSKDTWSWSTLSVSSSPCPAGRRAFAAVLLTDGRVLIHGGGDGVLQTIYDDGWILDLSKDPATWSSVSSLSQLGQRRDHFAVAYGSQVIIGFGYGASAPSTAEITVYNPSTDSFSDTFDPPSPHSPDPGATTGPDGTATPTYTTYATLPQPSYTTTIKGGHSGTNTVSSVHPTSTLDPNDPDGGSGNDDGGNSGDESSPEADKRKKTTAIAVGTAFGILGLLAVACAAVWYARRHHREREMAARFRVINNEGDDDDDRSPHMAEIPTAGVGYREKPRHRAIDVLSSIGLAHTNRRHAPERRDMLADEDTREFGWSPYRPGREGSNGSSWSLRSVLAGVRARREASSAGNSLLGTPWKEKGDPFSDGAALLKDEETGYIGAAAPAAGAMASAAAGSAYMNRDGDEDGTVTRPRGGAREGSDWSTYRDPFADPYGHSRESTQTMHNVASRAPSSDDLHHPTRPKLNGGGLVPPPPLSTALPLGMDAHTLSPLSERTSRNSLSDPSHSVSSHDHFSNTTHATTWEATGSIRSPHPTSVIDANPQSETSSLGILSNFRPVQRSDSWWNRFSRTSFLDRRASNASRRSGVLDIRDPNPAPRISMGLDAIKESSHSQAGSKDDESPRSGHSMSPTGPVLLQRGGSKRGSRILGGHGKSSSSLQTANTEQIERMGIGMDVAQRVITTEGSHRHTRSSFGTMDFSFDQGTEPSSPVYSESPITFGDVARAGSLSSDGRGVTGQSVRTPSYSSGLRASIGHDQSSVATDVTSDVNRAHSQSSGAVATIGHGHSPVLADGASTNARSASYSSGAKATIGHSPLTTPDAPSTTAARSTSYSSGARATLGHSPTSIDAPATRSASYSSKATVGHSPATAETGLSNTTRWPSYSSGGKATVGHSSLASGTQATDGHSLGSGKPSTTNAVAGGSAQKSYFPASSPSREDRTLSPLSLAIKSPSSPLKTPTPTASHASSVVSLPDVKGSDTSSGVVSSRVRDFERRMSRDLAGPLNPTNTRAREERDPRRQSIQVNYGLVPRPSLFVANPDRKGSDDS